MILVKNLFIQLLIIVLLTTIIISCNNSEEKKAVVEKIVIPQFNEDSAYFFVKKQVEFGPRVTNSIASKKCSEFLFAKMNSYAHKTIIQKGEVKTFENKILPFQNIIASFNPENQNRILLCSHWDSRPFADYDEDKKNYNTPIDGANDGASGVGILVEVARQLKINKVKIGVDIIFFDAEDYGQPEESNFPEKEDSWCLGTQYWAKTPHVNGYTAKFGILLDMVGASNPTFTKEGVSMYFASDVMNQVWETASKLGYSDFFINQKTGEITDDHYYINKIIKIPTIDIIHRDLTTTTGFYPYWHTTKDKIDVIDKNTLKMVGIVLLSVINEENNKQ